eukprot:Gregarina_sp_Poly_1__448@NODE_1108_length_5078_cov_259_161046_g768_i0_p1_GENE_NODE_1108_length_5078_cov_259_161046_g768_i0NODE_1108_length_5078_cov_259_161046_g768_i0_p1_ORF_typecomplete_len902_score132_62_NODE_1108_length_5078_cov_259_161046_g768_i09403645
MTTTRRAITPTDNSEPFTPYHAIPASITSGRGRHGPQPSITLPRFSAVPSNHLINQAALNDMSFNGMGQGALSSSHFQYNYASNSLARSAFPPLSPPGVWASTPPSVRQAVPLPPAQGYGMGQESVEVEMQAKRRRVNEDNTPTSCPTTASPSHSIAPHRASKTSPTSKSAGEVKDDPFLMHTSDVLTCSRAHTSSFTTSLSDSLLDTDPVQGVNDWAGMGDFALFNDSHHDAIAELDHSSEWSSSFMPFGEEETRVGAHTNNLFELKEEAIFSAVTRTESSSSSTDVTLRSFADSGSDLGDLQRKEGSTPAVATGRPLHSKSPHFDLAGSHSEFENSLINSNEPEHAGLNDSAQNFQLSGSIMDDASSSQLPSVRGATPASSPDGGSGGGSDASTAPSVSDFSRHKSDSGAPGGSESVKCHGPYSRSMSSKFVRKSSEGVNEIGYDHAHRPDLSQQTLEELNDISCFKNDEKYKKLIVDYSEGISFPLGEGGRELLRACLNVKGCKGRQLQGASVPALLALAKTWGLWDVAIRIKVERSSGQLCPQHDAFVKFKANQSQMRKYVKKEYMVTERDNQGCLSGIIYDERRKITLGKEGRESLRTQLRRLHDKHAGKMDDLLEKHGFKYSELRNATVQQLSRMAYVCNLWDKVVAACRKQEEKRDGRNREGSRLPTVSKSGRSFSETARMSEDYILPGGHGLSADGLMMGSRNGKESWKINGSSYICDLSGFRDGSATDLGLNHQEDNTLTDDYEMSYHSVGITSDSLDKSLEMKVKREPIDDTTNANESQKRSSRAALSIEDLLSTLTVNWECPTNESIEQFLRNQQVGHDTPVSEDNIFQAFSELVPSLSDASNSYVTTPTTASAGQPAAHASETQSRDDVTPGGDIAVGFDQSQNSLFSQ